MNFTFKTRFFLSHGSRLVKSGLNAVLNEARDFAHHPLSRFLGLFHKSKGRNKDDLTTLALVRR